MSAMQGMPMPGGWTMSMAWMRMPGQTWIQACASFLAMWIVMMVAMMLPSLAPMLWRYKSRFGLLTPLVGLAYFFVWTLVGFALFPLGVVLGQSRWANRHWLALFRSPLVWLSSSPAQSSSHHGRRITWPVAGKQKKTRARRGGRVCASDSIAC
jgi:predicted metal-binding membrane protein